MLNGSLVSLTSRLIVCMYNVEWGLCAHLPIFALAAASCSLKLRWA